MNTVNHAHEGRQGTQRSHARRLLALGPVLFLTSCASSPQPQIALKPLSAHADEPVESLRYAEVVRAYHVGRYVDPNQPTTLHEQHPVYRLESSAHWNLHPGPIGDAVLGSINAPCDAAFMPPPANDAVLAELNRQRQATETVMREATRLASAYNELQKVMAEMRTVARNSVSMNERLAAVEQRFTEFQEQLRNATAPLSVSTTYPTEITGE